MSDSQSNTPLRSLSADLVSWSTVVTSTEMLHSVRISLVRPPQTWQQNTQVIIYTLVLQHMFHMGHLPQTNYILDWLAELNSHFRCHTIAAIWSINNVYRNRDLITIHCNEINRSSWPGKWEILANKETKYQYNWSETSTWYIKSREELCVR